MHGIKVLMTKNYFYNLSEEARQGLDFFLRARRGALFQTGTPFVSPTVTRPQP
jgi:hypothetical protein